MYVYSRGLNRLRWAGRLAGHVLVAVMPITAFGRALALCPRTHPANGHPGRAHHAKRAVGLTASSGRLCTFDRLRADGRGNPISGAHLRGRDSVLSRCNWQKRLSHSALQAWAPSHQPCHSSCRPQAAWRVAPGWPTGLDRRMLDLLQTTHGHWVLSLYLGCKFGHGHEHVLGRGHGQWHGQYCCSLHLFARPAVRPPRGKLRLLDQLIRFPVDLDQVMGGLGGVNTTRVGPWGAGVTT